LNRIQCYGQPDRDYAKALKTHPDAWNILLRDSEGPLSSEETVEICKRNGWDHNSVFWMVQMMEAWFHADKNALERYYGDEFRREALRANPHVEQIPVEDLKQGLSAATKKTKKGDYLRNKAKHGSEILSRVEPSLVREHAPNCERFFAILLSRIEGG
jgi:hypothetical protein